MTSETRTLIDLNDIEGLEIKCLHCGMQVLYPVAKLDSERMTEKCPNCYQEWFPADTSFNDFKYMKNFIETLKLIIRRDCLKARIGLQVKPSASETSKQVP
jgi:DNA-directed RNA polymerase subunit RPC12/RpoP